MSQRLLQLLDLQKVPLHSRAWIVDVVRVRLVHFMAKAGYVKELVLQDWRIDNEGELRAFPELILPELIDTLKCTHAVTSIKVSANYNLSTCQKSNNHQTSSGTFGSYTIHNKIIILNNTRSKVVA